MRLWFVLASEPTDATVSRTSAATSTTGGDATDGESSPRARAGIAAARDLARHAEACFVRVPLPARSVAVLHGDARWHWQHAVLARDVVGRRTSVTLRTLSPALRDTEIGREVLDRAR